MTIKPNARLLTVLAAGFLLSSTALAEALIAAREGTVRPLSIPLTDVIGLGLA